MIELGVVVDSGLRGGVGPVGVSIAGPMPVSEPRLGRGIDELV